MMKQKRFTLIELLVVIAIIAILAAMLLPALGQVKEAGRASACAGNLKTIWTASTLYHADYKTYIQIYTHGNKSSLGDDWDRTIVKTIGYANVPTRVSWYNEKLSRGVLSCPAVTAPTYSEKYGNTVTHSYCYQYNGTFADQSISRLKRPTIAIMFGEGDVGYNFFDARSEKTDDGQLKNRHFRNRHGKAANIMYADGHSGKVDTWKIHYALNREYKMMLHPYGYY